MIELKLPMNIVYELVLTNSKRLYNGPYDFFLYFKKQHFDSTKCTNWYTWFRNTHFLSPEERQTILPYSKNSTFDPSVKRQLAFYSDLILPYFKKQHF